VRTNAEAFSHNASEQHEKNISIGALGLETLIFLPRFSIIYIVFNAVAKICATPFLLDGQMILPRRFDLHGLAL